MKKLEVKWVLVLHKKGGGRRGVLLFSYFAYAGGGGGFAFEQKLLM
jgi:hypothetical protein